MKKFFCIMFAIPFLIIIDIYFYFLIRYEIANKSYNKIFNIKERK